MPVKDLFFFRIGQTSTSTMGRSWSPMRPSSNFLSLHFLDKQCLTAPRPYTLLTLGILCNALRLWGRRCCGEKLASLLVPKSFHLPPIYQGDLVALNEGRRGDLVDGTSPKE